MKIEIAKIDLSAGLYLVASPIGNLDDITLRSLQILNSVDVIASEDTRQFKALAKHHNLSYEKLVSYNKDNEKESAKELARLIEKENKSIALISDAGTINISDPGHDLLSLHYSSDWKITSLPGPSSLVTALSLCPGIASGFTFHGFISKKSSQRKENLQSTLDGKAHVFFESCHRIEEHIHDAKEILQERPMLICKDLSKSFEKVLLTTPETALADIGDTTKGEYVIIYLPIGSATSPSLNLDLVKFIKVALELGLKNQQILKLTKTISSNSREELYNLIETTKDSQHGKI